MKKQITSILLVILLFTTILSVTGDLNDNLNDNDSKLVSTTDVDWWPTFHHDNNNSGFSTSEAPNTNDVLWVYPINDTILSSPVVVDGKLYIGAHDNNLYCLNIEDGSLNWSSNIGGWVDSHPVVDDGKVYVTISHTSEPYVKCLYAENGSLKWEYQIDTSTDAPLAVYDGKLYIGLTYWASDGNTDAFYCLNAENGSLIWRNIDGGSFTGPAIADGKVYVGQSSNIYCLDTETGEINWNYSASGSVQSPAIANGRVYFSSSWDNNTYCFDADPSDGVDEGIDDLDGVSYDLIWMFEIGGSVYSSPAVAYGNVYVGSNGGRKLYCLDAENGNETWNYTDNIPFFYSSPAVADGKVYIGAYYSNFYCIDAENGAEIWKYLIGGYIYSSPAIADGKVYISSKDGDVYCFRENEAPDIPDQPDGPTSGYVDEEYTYTTGPVTDPEDEGPVEYLFDWGDGTDSGWIDAPSASTNWSEGTYNVTVKARDIWHKPSDFSIPLEVTIVIPNPILEIEITGGKGITIVISNVGDLMATNVEWNMTIDGGFFINPMGESGDIPTIDFGDSNEVPITVFGIGLGILSNIPIITVTAECAEGAFAEVNATARILFSRVFLQE